MENCARPGDFPNGEETTEFGNYYSISLRYLLN